MIEWQELKKNKVLQQLTDDYNEEMEPLWSYLNFLEEEAKVRDCFHTNSFGAKYLQKVFLVFENYEIDHIELGDFPERWVKIVYGREIPEMQCEASE